jgi:hypothetical protein
LVAPETADNRFEAKGSDLYGQRAHEILSQVRAMIDAMMLTISNRLKGVAFDMKNRKKCGRIADACVVAK